MVTTPVDEQCANIINTIILKALKAMGEETLYRDHLVFNEVSGKDHSRKVKAAGGLDHSHRVQAHHLSKFASIFARVAKEDFQLGDWAGKWPNSAINLPMFLVVSEYGQHRDVNEEAINLFPMTYNPDAIQVSSHHHFFPSFHTSHFLHFSRTCTLPCPLTLPSSTTPRHLSLPLRTESLCSEGTTTHLKIGTRRFHFTSTLIVSWPLTQPAGIHTHFFNRSWTSHSTSNCALV